MGLTSVLLPLTLGEATGTALIPLLLAATPLPVGSAVPFREPTVIQQELPQGFGEQVQVETFDPVARAAVIAQELPRQWSGTYQSFGSAPPQTVQLTLASAIALGQMVDVRGEITVGGTTVPVQGNINAKSDQLDLLFWAMSARPASRTAVSSAGCRASASPAGGRPASPTPAASSP